jgi:hypothetical protein
MMKRYLTVLLCLLWAGVASAQDAIDLSTAVVHNSPADVASWARTTRISQLNMAPENSPHPGLSFEFPAHATWPNFTPPGWDGPIQYTVWAGVRISGVWHVAGIIQMWREREATGAPILANNNFARNWVYDSRWGAMAHYQPVAGEAMVFFLTAGNARGITGVTSVRERSNVVLVNLPANDSGVFRFAQQQTDLLIDFGAQGLWTLTDAVNYASVPAPNPKNMVTGDIDGNGIDEVVADFGEGNGLWIRWNGAGWGQLHWMTANALAMGDLDNNGKKDVIIDFPASGTHIFWNGGTWEKIHDMHPTRILVADIDGGRKDVVLDLPGWGLWIYRNASSWIQLNYRNSTAMAAGDFDADGMGDIAIAFPDYGVWLFMNGSTWVPASPHSAVALAAGNLDGNRRSDLVVDFGPGRGIWLLSNGTAWSGVHVGTSEQLVLGDLDGNGQDDVIIDFGAGGNGVWVLGNLTTWIHAHPLSPEQIVVGSLN